MVPAKPCGSSTALVTFFFLAVPWGLWDFGSPTRG